jgi:23S rRNA (cytosine1962-C5)-methyltransferase
MSAPNPSPPPTLHLIPCPPWQDYALLDSGGGRKLERYGPYTFVRPEHQAVWRPAWPAARWEAADATFQSTGEESGGRWRFSTTIPTTWKMHYHELRFQAHAAASRHMGVFPEQAAHWDWMAAQIRSAGRPLRVLNLFGYTGLASLACAQAGAQVTHVDASKKAIAAGRANQELSGLSDRPIRWLVDDVLKFVRREIRRGSVYDGLVLDPPKFGRGPDGQVWELFASLAELLGECRRLLSPEPRFVVITAYAIRASALTTHYALDEMMAGLGGALTTGELTLTEESAGRRLATAITSRWAAEEERQP